MQITSSLKFRSFFSLSLSTFSSIPMICERKLMSRDHFFSLYVEFMHIHSYVFKSFINCVRIYASSQNVIEIHMKNECVCVCVHVRALKVNGSCHKQRYEEIQLFQGVKRSLTVRSRSSKF